jgi:hypothetical protein
MGSEDLLQVRVGFVDSMRMLSPFSQCHHTKFLDSTFILDVLHADRSELSSILVVA